MNKTVGEYLQGANLWDEINSIETFPFINPETDTLFLLRQDDALLFSGIEKLTVPELAQLIVNVFSDKWNAVINATIDLDPMADTTRVVDETGSRTENVNTDNTETEKVSAYNSANFVDNKQTVTNGTEDTTGSKNRKLTEKTYSAKTAFDNLTQAEKANIIDVAMSDVAAFITLSIYR